MSSYFIMGEQVVTGGSTNQANIMDQLIIKFIDDSKCQQWICELEHCPDEEVHLLLACL